MKVASENLARVRGDRLDLGYLAGDELTVQETTTAEHGQIVVVLRDRGYYLCRYTGAEQVVGLVLAMHRRVPGAAEVVS